MKYNLKQWRGVKGMTQGELAEASGVQITKIAVLETISIDDVQKLKDALMLKATDSIIMP